MWTHAHSTAVGSRSAPPRLHTPLGRAHGAADHDDPPHGSPLPLALGEPSRVDAAGLGGTRHGTGSHATMTT